jgi:hypothetical protein
MHAVLPRLPRGLSLLALSALLAATALGAASCSDSSSSTEATGSDGGSATSDGRLDAPLNLDGFGFDAASLSPYTLDNVCDLTAPKFCALRKGCCLQTAGFDEAACEAHEKARCAQNVADVKAGNLKFTGMFIDTCLAGLQPFMDKCVLSFGDLPDLAKVFGCHPFVGKLGSGEPCDRDEQCAPFPSGLTSCDKKKKTCSFIVFSAVDTGCVGSFLCDKGLYCATPDASSPICRPASAVGQPCSPASATNPQCGLGNRCDQPTGLCAPAKAGGVGCTTGLECASLECTSPAGTCAPQTPLASPAECVGP